MPTGPAKPADEISDSIRSLIDRVVDARFTQEMAQRGQEAATTVGGRASEAWRDSKPIRRDAASRLSRATEDATKWGGQAWRRSLRPALRDLWKRRTLAIGAAGAAVPAGKELVDTAAERLGVRRRHERHWGAFLLGVLLGAVGGAIVAMLTTPKRGSEMRRELADRAGEVTERAKEGEWVPIFQRPTNGKGVEDALAGSTGANLQEGAAETGAATGEAAEQAAADTAEAINEAYDVDRESPA